jgi:hypothetical protein
MCLLASMATLSFVGTPASHQQLHPVTHITARTVSRWGPNDYFIFDDVILRYARSESQFSMESETVKDNAPPKHW